MAYRALMTVLDMVRPSTPDPVKLAPAIELESPLQNKNTGPWFNGIRKFQGADSRVPMAVSAVS